MTKKTSEKDRRIELTANQADAHLAVPEDFPLIGAPIPTTTQKRKSRTKLDSLGRQLLQK